MPQSDPTTDAAAPNRQLASIRLPLLVVLAVVLFISAVLWIWTTSQARRDKERSANQPVSADVDPLEREVAAREAALERAERERKIPFFSPARSGAVQGFLGAFEQRAIGAPFNPRDP